MLSCKEVARLVSASLDGGLSFRQRLALRVHLLLCSGCCRFRRQMLFLREAVGRHTGADAPDDANGLSAEARERIRRALEREVR
jgi:Putative zinc-finger